VRTPLSPQMVKSETTPTIHHMPNTEPPITPPELHLLTPTESLLALESPLSLEFPILAPQHPFSPTLHLGSNSVQTSHSINPSSSSGSHPFLDSIPSQAKSLHSSIPISHSHTRPVHHNPPSYPIMPLISLAAGAQPQHSASTIPHHHHHSPSRHHIRTF